MNRQSRRNVDILLSELAYMPYASNKRWWMWLFATIAFENRGKWLALYTESLNDE